MEENYTRWVETLGGLVKNLFLREKLSTIEEEAAIFEVFEPGDLFSVTFSIFCREFKGQSSGRKLEDATIIASDLEDFKQKLFLKVSPLLKREIILDAESYCWSNEAIKEPDLISVVCNENRPPKLHVRLFNNRIIVQLES